MEIAIDLLWLRPRQVGGTEFYIRNLLDGFLQLKEPFRFTLLVSKDNRESFEHYTRDERITLLEADVISADIAKRVLWQFFCENRFLRKHGIKKCFSPVYCRPLFNGGITYINTIHDLQAAHYPEYHPFYEIAYSRLCWWLDAHLSKHIVAISDWVKNDIIKHYHISEHKITTIYNPIVINRDDAVSIEVLQQKYDIQEKGYYYTVAQMIPHKNLDTLIGVMECIKKEEINLPRKLLISGVNGSSRQIVEQLIVEKGLEKEVILTGFVNNEERNALYKYCKAFLFPSVFEGFGMPPIEAMLFGSIVITTDRTCIPEVTQNKSNYVIDPFDPHKWIEVMKNPVDHIEEVDFQMYDQIWITKQYYQLLEEV